MKTICFFALFCSLLALVSAATTTAERPPLFAGAYIKVTGPTWENSAEVSKVPEFRRHITREMLGHKGAAHIASWQFVGRSDVGDVYVFVFTLPDNRRDIVPVVFTGSPTIVERGAIRIELSIPAK
jgi:hypothetical protein